MRSAERIPPQDSSGVNETRALGRLSEIAIALRFGTDFSTLVDVAMDVLHTEFEACHARIYLIDDRNGSLRAWDPKTRQCGDPYMPVTGGILNTAVLREEPLFLSYPAAEAPEPEPDLWDEECRAAIAFPLISGNDPHGVMYAALRRSPKYTATERTLLSSTATALSFALERNRRLLDIAMMRDQMQHVETEAEQREGLLGQMLSVVAHEMRTPLTAIKAYAEALLDAPDETADTRLQFLAIINEECDRLGRMLANAVDYSRLESGQRSLILSEFAPRDLMRDVVLTLTPEADKRSVRITDQDDSGIETVEGDPDLIKQLCLNLTGNAIKFSPEGDGVTLRISGDENYWRLDVSDHGHGIPEDQREKIFERFYRVDGDGSRGVPGTGLGLAIARGIAELHGGRIWVAANDGGGSTFSVELPRVQRAPTEARQVTQGLWQHPAAKQFLQYAVEIIAEVMDARIISMMGVHPEAGDLRVIAAIGLENNATNRRVSYRGGIAGRALADGNPVLVNDIEADPRFQRPNHPQYFTKSLLCLPVQVGGHSVGVINVNNKRSREPFDKEDLALLTRLVERMASAMERIRAFPDAEEPVIEGLASMRAITRRHPELAIGRRSVGDYAFTLALRMGASGAQALRLAAVADPGAEGLLGGRRVSDAGMDLDELSEELAENGVPNAEITAAPRPTRLGEPREIVLSVDEWWDGSGYPHGTSGEEIPHGARILAVVRTFHQWTSGRAYRAAMSPEDALDAIESLAGRRFDPEVVAELAAILEEESQEEST